MPAELSEQVPVIRNLLQVMNIRIYAEEGIEADDILGTMAKKSGAGRISCFHCIR